MERHINIIYSKLQNDKPEGPGALMDLKAVGLLSGANSDDDKGLRSSIFGVGP